MGDLSNFIWINLGWAVIVKATIVLGIVTVLDLALRRRSAALRHWLWVLATATALVLPLVGFLVTPWQPNTDTLDLHELSGATLIWPPELVVPESEDGVGSPAPIAVDSRNEPYQQRELRLGHAQQASQASSPSWMSTLIALWGAGSALVLFGMTAGALRGGSRGNEGESYRATVENPKLMEMLRPNSGMHWVHSPTLTTPMLTGLFRQTVHLPGEFTDWPIPKQKACQAFARSSAKRYENLALLGASILCVVYWFHPMVWIAAYRMRRLGLYASDDAAVRETDDADSYADMLQAFSDAEQRRSQAPCHWRARIGHATAEQKLRGGVRRHVMIATGAVAVTYAAIVGTVGVDPRIAFVVEAQRDATHPRTPLVMPGEPGRASDYYYPAEEAAVMLIAENRDSYYENDGWTSFLTVDGWKGAPEELRELGASEDAGDIASLLESGASRTDGTSTFRSRYWKFDVGPLMPAFKASRILDAVALGKLERGQGMEACRLWLAKIRYGQDKARGTALIGAMIGVTIEQQAASNLRAVVEQGDLTEHELLEILTLLQTLIKTHPRVGDILWDEAIMRLAWSPVRGDLDRNRALRKTLDERSGASTAQRVELMQSVSAMSDKESSWPLYVHRYDYLESLVRATYIYVALHLDRHSRGTWAPTLGDLVPRIVPSLPMDRISGGPFEYVRSGAGGATLRSALAERATRGGGKRVELEFLGTQPEGKAEGQ